MRGRIMKKGWPGRSAKGAKREGRSDFFQRAIRAEAQELAAPFDAVAQEGKDPEGGLEEVFEGDKPE